VSSWSTTRPFAWREAIQAAEKGDYTKLDARRPIRKSL
jgi:hypothetical protein